MSFDKPIFNGLMHTGQPDFEALYRMGKINMYARNSFAGWDDPQGLPTSVWYDAFASGVVAPRKMLMLDHEVWSYSTQAERQATAGKYVTLYQQIKQRRRAECRADSLQKTTACRAQQRIPRVSPGSGRCRPERGIADGEMVGGRHQSDDWKVESSLHESSYRTQLSKRAAAGLRSVRDC